MTLATIPNQYEHITSLEQLLESDDLKSLCEGLGDIRKVVDQIIRLIKDPMEFVYSYFKSNPTASSTSIQKALKKKAQEYQKKSRQNIQEHHDLAESVVSDLLSGAYQIGKKTLKWVVSKIWDIFLEVIRWSWNHPIGRLAIAIFLLTISSATFLQLTMLVAPGYTTAVYFAMMAWILFEGVRVIGKANYAENLKDFFTRENYQPGYEPVKITDWIPTNLRLKDNF